MLYRSPLSAPRAGVEPTANSAPCPRPAAQGGSQPTSASGMHSALAGTGPDEILAHDAQCLLRSVPRAIPRSPGWLDAIAASAWLRETGSACPMASGTSARARTGASTIPSPIIAARRPAAWAAVTTLALGLGRGFVEHVVHADARGQRQGRAAACRR
ncbi:MAG: hypothetical protein IPK42_11390 [Betaproteobacteria bacterium]|nr:hypothetical protein [Betaproteobacteria bacterium]